MTQDDVSQRLKVALKDLFASPEAIGEYRNKLTQERLGIGTFPNHVLFSCLNCQLAGGAYAGDQTLPVDSAELHFNSLADRQRNELQAYYLKLAELEAGQTSGV